MPWWPRSIKGQMLAGLLLLESLSIGLFAWVVTWQQVQEVHDRARRRAAYQAESLALEVREALIEKSPSWSALSVRMMEQAPTAATVKISDPQGNVLFNGPSHPSQRRLSAAELRQIPLIPRDRSLCFVLPDRGTECAHTVIVSNDLRGFTWIESDPAWDYEELNAVQQDTAIFAVIWLVASCLLVLIMARSIAQPLAVLHRGTKALMGSPEDTQGFPLPVSIHNEMGDLIEAFNRMVASLAEQRAGLNDTLSLLDSMLANAPIGLAFFDRNCRMMRVNQVFADMTGVRLPRHLGKTLPEVLSQPTAHELEEAVLRVFESNEPIRNLEFGGKSGNTGREWTWLVSAYPVRTTPPEVRWVGVIAMDASERKRSEDALRNSEKLAVTGRLAASIAHEINNPLEAVTNLVYLLRNFTALGATPLHYIEMLEYEVRRISEITQQTLRFYRQSTQPTRATLSEILDSVLSLYRGRFNAYEIRVERGYDPQTTLHCFAGEVRQVIANLVGNAIDACMTSGGRLIVRAWRSREWKNPDREGLRFVIADTGPGIPAPIRERIFEPFFTTKEATGTGLGLWISREIVSKHGGTMRLRTRTASPHSAETGTASGTVFQFFIPDDPEPLREAAAYRPTPARETTAD